MYKTLRVRFSKRGAGAYISHLDLTRTTARALRRTGLDFYMSGGFNPHIRIVFGMPLSLGYTSCCEIFDVKVRDSYSLSELTPIYAAFPYDLEINELYFPTTKLAQAVYAKYEITLHTDSNAEAIKDLFCKPVVMTKRTKRSETRVDINEYIKAFEVTDTSEGVMVCPITACSNTQNLNPSYIVEAISNVFDVKDSQIKRTALLFEDLSVFK